MAVVDTWDGANRRIYLKSGITEFHPIDDIYREYRTQRRTNEAFRVWEPFMVAIGNEPKGGGFFSPRYLRLLGGAKIICFDEAITITVTGEVLTDDQTDPFDYSTRTQPVVVRYKPAEAELIEIPGSGLTDAESAALITTADEATLARKLADADETLAEGDDSNWVLIDSDDGVTVLRTPPVKDKHGNAITLPAGVPASRTRVP